MADSSDSESDFGGFLGGEVRQTEVRREDLEEDYSDIEIIDIELDSNSSGEDEDLDLLQDGGKWTRTLTHSIKY
jgi:hypothetical protein